MTGGAVSGPVILGGAGPEHFSGSWSWSALWQRWPWPTAGSRRAGCGRACSTCRSQACRDELDGLRIAHLSDFHLGPPSRGAVAVRQAADWVRERKPDLTVVTGDLLSHPRGRAQLDEALRGLDAYACSGITTSPSRAIRSRGRPLERPAGDAARRRVAAVELRGVRVQLAGDRAAPVAARFPTPIRPPCCASCSATTRACRRLATSSCSPATCTPARSCCRTRAASSVSRTSARRLTEGLYREGGVTLHVSPGLGTTLRPVPVLRAARGDRARSAKIRRDGRPCRHLRRRARELRRRRGPRGRPASTVSSGARCTATRA